MRTSKNMNIQDIYHYFQSPPPTYLSREIAVCFVAFVLTERGDSYGTALLRLIEDNYPHLQLSCTVLHSAIDFLVKERVIRGYLQRYEGRGRSRKMYQICDDHFEEAVSLALLWHQYVDGLPSLH